MTDLQHERAVCLVDTISERLQLLVDAFLKCEEEEVEDLVRTLLTENMRFWKRP